MHSTKSKYTLIFDLSIFWSMKDKIYFFLYFLNTGNFIIYKIYKILRKIFNFIIWNNFEIIKTIIPLPFLLFFQNKSCSIPFSTPSSFNPPINPYIHPLNPRSTLNPDRTKHPREKPLESNNASCTSSPERGPITTSQKKSSFTSPSIGLILVAFNFFCPVNPPSPPPHTFSPFPFPWCHRYSIVAVIKVPIQDHSYLSSLGKGREGRGAEIAGKIAISRSRGFSIGFQFSRGRRIERIRELVGGAMDMHTATSAETILSGGYWKSKMEKYVSGDRVCGETFLSCGLLQWGGIDEAVL